MNVQTCLKIFLFTITVTMILMYVFIFVNELKNNENTFINSILLMELFDLLINLSSVSIDKGFDSLPQTLIF